MIRITLNEALPGMKLYRPVIEAQGRVLLGADAVLTDSYLEGLRSFDARYLWIRDDWTEDILDPQFFSDQVRARVSGRLREIVEGLQADRSTLKGVLSGGPFGALADEALMNRQELMPAPEAGPSETPLMAHCVRVCLLAAALGPHLLYNREQIINLSVGALLHDLGHFLISGAERYAPGRAGDEARKHPSLGFEVLVHTRNLSATAAAMCMQHHERPDGTGWPRGLHLEALHPFSRLLAVADRYDVLAEGAQPVLPHVALETLRSEAGTALDAELVDLFIARVMPYPPGTPLRLSTGEQAVVVRVNRARMDRPVVRILFGIVRDVDLSQEPDLAIEAVSWFSPVATPAASAAV